MSINDKLQNMYKDGWAELQTALKPLDPCCYTNPFLLAFDEEQFNKADLKVMIFGQETKGWGDKFGMLETPQATAAMYEKFFCQKDFYKGYGKSSFWKAFRFFEKEIQNTYPEKSIYFSWNNINKIGKSKGKTGVSSEARAVERSNFSVIASEVQAFIPDIVIFLTGPTRDGDIKHHFNDAIFNSVHSDIKTRALAKVTSEFLPNRSLRMYHPTYFGGFNKVRKLALQELFN